ncbi:MAG: globin [Dehalococcoidia bacterium]
MRKTLAAPPDVVSQSTPKVHYACRLNAPSHSKEPRAIGPEHNPNSKHIRGSTVYDRVGGHPFFTELVDRFYEAVAVDPLLRPLYPADLGPGKAHLAAFLAQYWGGPPQYTKERGHPRLRMRHAQFSIGQAERDAWVKHMCAAVAAMDVTPEDAAELAAYFERTATLLINNHA